MMQKPMDEDIRLLLNRLADGEAHSSSSLATHLGTSPAVIRHKIHRLRQHFGMDITTRRSHGYQLASPLEWLDPQTIRDGLSDTARALLGGLRILFSVDSTNRWLVQQTGLPQGMACLAEHQTQGRGRQGRCWVSPLSGNLYLSLSWNFPALLPQSSLAGLSLAVGVMTLEALQKTQSIEGLTLKWPNDLLWQGLKLGGLLLETTRETHGPTRLILGVGINLRMPAGAGQKIDQPWVDLARVFSPHNPPTRNPLAAILLNAYLPGLRDYPTLGLEGYLARWRGYDALANRRVTVRLGDRSLQGICLGIADTGALRLLTHTGEQQLHAGEVQVQG
ncbi:MAG: biotin--[acetyl-CoA-carboxylase] ligase [Pseudomonadota bacterium]